MTAAPVRSQLAHLHADPVRIGQTGVMSDLFSLFDSTPANEPTESTPTPVMMTDDQRAEIKALFVQLGVSTAREQFAIIEEFTAVRISSVQELQAAHAHRAIEGLRRRVSSMTRVRTGNAWDDRDEPTWLDRL